MARDTGEDNSLDLFVDILTITLGSVIFLALLVAIISLGPFPKPSQLEIELRAQLLERRIKIAEAESASLRDRQQQLIEQGGEVLQRTRDIWQEVRRDNLESQLSPILGGIERESERDLAAALVRQNNALVRRRMMLGNGIDIFSLRRDELIAENRELEEAYLDRLTIKPFGLEGTEADNRQLLILGLHEGKIMPTFEVTPRGVRRNLVDWNWLRRENTGELFGKPNPAAGMPLEAWAGFLDQLREDVSFPPAFIFIITPSGYGVAREARQIAVTSGIPVRFAFEERELIAFDGNPYDPLPR